MIGNHNASQICKAQENAFSNFSGPFGKQIVFWSANPRIKSVITLFYFHDGAVNHLKYAILRIYAEIFQIFASQESISRYEFHTFWNQNTLQSFTIAK